MGAVRAALEASGLAPERLELEVTETVLLRETEATLAALHQLRGLGIQIALDDFGTGYSSLGYLQRFPFDRVKLDRRFVLQLGHTKASDAIVQCVLDLCAALNISVTAEGLETEEQYRLLSVAGCGEAQGFLFGKGVPGNEVPRLLAAARAGADAPLQGQPS
jgi:EAL domain-containing protein (putative c-di-GMP-specific phosphodiesterase class I)